VCGAGSNPSIANTAAMKDRAATVRERGPGIPDDPRSLTVAALFGLRQINFSFTSEF